MVRQDDVATRLPKSVSVAFNGERRGGQAGRAKAPGGALQLMIGAVPSILVTNVRGRRSR